MRYSALLTDLYELTMLAGYFEKGMHERPAVFDLFFRKAPFMGNYAVFAGLETALDYLSQLRFTADDLTYLRRLGIFKPSFLEYLKNFRFRGKVTAVPEGTVVFANEPLITVEGPMAQAQFVETALLNLINFQTLVATKAARLTVTAENGVVVEFGLRRAQGPDGGLSAVRAAYIGGVRSTSNVWGGKTFNIPVKGTHAHSWIMSFPDELSAFRAYADVFPDSSVLLVDTYDTLESGIPNAITVAGELRARGHELMGVRLDSGDLAYLSRKAREMLDRAGFPGVKILASNELDEYIIRSIRDQGGRVDIYGVGTRLATCFGEGGGALGGIYKLVRFDGRPKLKVTSDIAKSTIPDCKRLFRVENGEGNFLMDVICRESELPEPGDIVYDPLNPARHKAIPAGSRLRDMRRVVMEGGRIVFPSPTLDEMADRAADQLRRLPEGSLRLEIPHTYKVSMSRGLYELRTRLIEEVHMGYGRREAEIVTQGEDREGTVDSDGGRRMEMEKGSALLIVDMQVDFCPGGSLAVPDGDGIIPVINRYARLFRERGLPVLASRDWHPAKTVHFRGYGGIWPAHCVQGSAGAAFHPGLALPEGVVILSKGMDPDRDDEYSDFHAVTGEGVPFASFLRDRGISRLYVCGIATDYCVRATVMDALGSGLGVILLEDAVRGVDLVSGDSAAAIAEMTAAGAGLMRIDGLTADRAPRQ